MPKPNLAQALHEQSDENNTGNVAVKNPPVTENKAQKKVSPRRKSTREDKVNIAAWFPLGVQLQLDEIRIELSRQQGRKVLLQDILAEAYNDLFKKYGKPELAPTSGK